MAKTSYCFTQTREKETDRKDGKERRGGEGGCSSGSGKSGNVLMQQPVTSVLGLLWRGHLGLLHLLLARTT